jgi:hypothetical protein
MIPVYFKFKSYVILSNIILFFGIVSTIGSFKFTQNTKRSNYILFLFISLNEKTFPPLSQFNLNFLAFFSSIQPQSIPFSKQILLDFSINNYKLLQVYLLYFLQKHLHSDEMMKLLFLLSPEGLIPFI